VVEDRKPSAKVFDAINIVLLVGIGLLSLLPMWYTLCVSLSEKSAVAAGLVNIWPIGFNFKSYAQIVNDTKFFHSFWVSLQRVVLGGSLTFIVVVLMAYPLSKSSRDFRGRNVLMWILIFTMLFNGGLIPWYQTIRSLHLINSIWALVLGGSVPVFNVILVVNFFRSLPKELEEAALVDGAGPWRMLFKIYLPLAVPVLATITLFSVVYHWNEFFNGLVLTTRQERFPLQTYIQQMVVVINTTNMTEDQYKRMSELSNQTLNAAKIFIAMIPILLVYPFAQRYFISGIMLGSVKE
jgi:ABC-type glycerol-3-phosphate transport system permease component